MSESTVLPQDTLQEHNDPTESDHAADARQLLRAASVCGGRPGR